MKTSTRLLGLLMTAILSACGGGEDGTPVSQAPPPPPPPVDVSVHATPTGSAVGAMAQATIGPTGGSLNSADGSVTLVVPAGAFSTATQLSIQSIDNQGHGGPGKAYRIQPEGLQTTVPPQLDRLSRPVRRRLARGMG